MSGLKNKVVVVTGGSRGIGAAIVLKLASLGANVAFSYVSKEKKAKKIEAEAKKHGVSAKASKVDVQDFEAVKQWIQEVKKEFGSLDVLINNAGIVSDKPLMMMSQEDWQKVINVNLNGTFNATKSCVVTFMKQKSGNIVNISSVSGIIGLAGQSNYSASKGGMNAFTKALAKELAGFNIRVNAVAPGFIDTDILSNLKEEHIKEIIEYVPVGKLGSVQDVASAVEFLLSDDSKYITGQIIQVDGGLALR